MTMKYVVMQGKMTETGNGDFYNEGTFDTLEEAQKKMNEIKENIDGYTSFKKGYRLETMIDKVNEDGEYIDTVDGYTYYPMGE